MMKRLVTGLFFVALLLSCSAGEDLKPEALELGASAQEIRNNVQGIAVIEEETDFEGRHLPSAQNVQSQIVLRGFPYQGQDRRVKLVFSDDRLDMIWIDLEPGEDDRLESEFEGVYGEPSHRVSTTTAWMDEGMAIINAPPQVLILSDSLRETYARFLDQVQKQEEKQ